jgi:hypothetical protein
MIDIKLQNGVYTLKNVDEGFIGKFSCSVLNDLMHVMHPWSDVSEIVDDVCTALSATTIEDKNKIETFFKSNLGIIDGAVMPPDFNTYKPNPNVPPANIKGWLVHADTPQGDIVFGLDVNERPDMDAVSEALMAFGGSWGMILLDPAEFSPKILVSNMPLSDEDITKIKNVNCEVMINSYYAKDRFYMGCVDDLGLETFH